MKYQVKRNVTNCPHLTDRGLHLTCHIRQDPDCGPPWRTSVWHWTAAAAWYQWGGRRPPLDWSAYVTESGSGWWAGGHRRSGHCAETRPPRRDTHWEPWGFSKSVWLVLRAPMQWPGNDWSCVIIKVRPVRSRTRSSAAGSLQGLCWDGSVVGPLQADATSHLELLLWSPGFQPLRERVRAQHHSRSKTVCILDAPGGKFAHSECINVTVIYQRGKSLRFTFSWFQLVVRTANVKKQQN